MSRLPFFAGIVLGISGLLSVVLGLYKLSTWHGWLFIGVGLLVAASAAMLVFKVPGGTLIAVVAALASLTISAIWVGHEDYFWSSVAAMGLDLLAIYALSRTKLRLWTGRDPLRT